MRARWTLGIGLVALATAVAAGTHLRAEERAEAAARAAASAEAAYRDQVAQVLPSVHAARVPLLEADALFAVNESIAFDVYGDVRVHGAIAADLRDAHGALAAVPAPAPLQEVHASLLGDLERMRVAADALASTKDENLDTHLTGFRQAGLSFDWALNRRFGLPVELPRTADLPADRLTHAGLLYRWSSTCSAALDESDARPELAVNDLAAIANEADREAALLARVLNEMQATEVPAADAAVLEREVRAPLRSLAPVPQVLRDVAGALRARDRDQLRDALLALDEVSPSLERVADAMQRHGSPTCALLFDAGLVDGVQGPQSGDEVQA